MTDLKEDGDTIIIQTKVPEELTQSTLNSQGDGESLHRGRLDFYGICGCFG